MSKLVASTKLMDHQKRAFDKLSNLKVGALYMDMGTGKTRTMIEIALDKINRRKADSIIWFCPVNAKKNIEKQVLFHCPDLLDRMKIVGLESIAMSDRMYIDAMDYISKTNCILVIDESHKVKNWGAKTTKRMITMANKLNYKFILTGTPTPRNEADLFSQWYIIDRRIFGYMTYWSFAANHLETDDYGRIVEVLNVDYLTNKIAPYTYRVRKEDLDLNLLAKKSRNFYFSLTGTQLKHYEDVKMELSSQIVNDWDIGPIFRLLTGLMLVVSGRELVELRADRPLESKPFFEDPMKNPRIEALDYILSDFSEKAIIWCNYKHEVDEISYMMEQKGYTYTILDGSISTKVRDKNLSKFEGSTQFLIANKQCGSESLNLQFAHNAIYYTNNFDWGTRVQSEDRIHRIGQDKQVNYIDLHSDTGIENMIFRNLSKKENLDYSLSKMLKDKNLLFEELGVKNDKNRIIEESEVKAD